MSADELRAALKRAFNLGQTYWQQADSLSRAENRRSDETRAKFNTLVEETVAALGGTSSSNKADQRHPIQPLVTDKQGVLRFKPNAVVCALLEHGQRTGMGMNELAMLGLPHPDYEQFAQLIGYSLSGFGELSYVTDETYEAAAAGVETWPRAGSLSMSPREARGALYADGSPVGGVREDGNG